MSLRLLAACRPLAWHMPATDFFGLGRIFHVEYDYDVADVAIHRRRDVGVAAVEIVAVHAAAGAHAELKVVAEVPTYWDGIAVGEPGA